MSENRYLVVVTSEVPQDIDAAWNDWYGRVHLPEIADCPGFGNARRWVFVDDLGHRHYLATYEVAGPASLETSEFAARRGWGAFEGRVRFETRCYSSLDGPDVSGEG